MLSPSILPFSSLAHNHSVHSPFKLTFRIYQIKCQNQQRLKASICSMLLSCKNEGFCLDKYFLPALHLFTKMFIFLVDKFHNSTNWISNIIKNSYDFKCKWVTVSNRPSTYHLVYPLETLVFRPFDRQFMIFQGVLPKPFLHLPHVQESLPIFFARSTHHIPNLGLAKCR